MATPMGHCVSTYPVGETVTPTQCTRIEYHSTKHFNDFSITVHAKHGNAEFQGDISLKCFNSYPFNHSPDTVNCGCLPMLPYCFGLQGGIWIANHSAITKFK